MLKSSTFLLTAALFCGGQAARAADFERDVFDVTYDCRRHAFPGDLYERRYRQDVFSELQKVNEDRKMREMVKKFPGDNPLQDRLNKRIAAISSTNFTANTNVAPMEIVPGLSGGN